MPPAPAGDQFKLNDLIMRRGAYAGLAYGAAGEPDAGFDLYAAVGGTADGKWPAGGTGDGTHPSEARQAAAAADARAAAAGAARLLTPPAVYRASSRMPSSRPARVIGYIRPSKIARIIAVERL